MRGKVFGTAVGLGLDDSSRRFALCRAMNEDHADALARDGEHRPRVKVARKFHVRSKSRLGPDDLRYGLISPGAALPPAPSGFLSPNLSSRYCSVR